MGHYPHLTPTERRRLERRGIDVERSTDDFLDAIRTGRGRIGRDAFNELSALMTGAPASFRQLERQELIDRHHRRAA